jgi:predicted metal-binding membrane protein
LGERSFRSGRRSRKTGCLKPRRRLITGMWVVMMVAMLLPSMVPMLWRYRQAVGRTDETRLGRQPALVGVDCFFVWTVFGMAAFPLGVALAAIEMQQPALARAVRIAVGVVVLIAGSLQLTGISF